MKKVYAYINALGHIPEGVICIDGVTYKTSKITNLRYSQIPEVGSWNNVYFGVWVIRPKCDILLKVELI